MKVPLPSATGPDSVGVTLGPGPCPSSLAVLVPPVETTDPYVRCRPLFRLHPP